MNFDEFAIIDGASPFSLQKSLSKKSLSGLSLKESRERMNFIKEVLKSDHFRMTIVIHHAKNLPALDRNGYSDPFCCKKWKYCLV